MGLKNYTTSIDYEKSIMQIEKILAKFGANNIYKQYGDKGVPIGLAFQIIVDDKPLGFKLPMDETKILQVFKNQQLPGKYTNIEQARRTGWRIIKDWIDSQVALMEVNLVKIEEVFLPYLYNQQTDKTLYQTLKDRKFDMQLEYDTK